MNFKHKKKDKRKSEREGGEIRRRREIDNNEMHYEILNERIVSVATVTVANHCDDTIE